MISAKVSARNRTTPPRSSDRSFRKSASQQQRETIADNLGYAPDPDETVITP